MTCGTGLGVSVGLLTDRMTQQEADSIRMLASMNCMLAVALPAT